MDQELVEYLSGMEARLGARFSTELVAGLADVKLELRTEFRREIGVAVEHLDGRIQLLAELVQLQNEAHERRHAEIWTELSSLNQRFTHLQAHILRRPDPR